MISRVGFTNKTLLRLEDGTLLSGSVTKDGENVGNDVGILDLIWKVFEKLSYFGYCVIDVLILFMFPLYFRSYNTFSLLLSLLTQIICVMQMMCFPFYFSLYNRYSLHLSFLSSSGFGTSYQNIHNSNIQINDDSALNIGDDGGGSDKDAFGAMVGGVEGDSALNIVDDGGGSDEDAFCPRPASKK